MLKLRDEQWKALDPLLHESLRTLPSEWQHMDQLLDTLLENEQLIELFSKKHPSRMGRPTYPIEKYFRLMVVKFRYQWGYETLVKEVGDSFTLRRFCRIGLDEEMPDPTTLIKICKRYGEHLSEKLNECLVKELTQQRVIRHRKLRTDTTVVESDIHHPTDVSLLQDGVRVITRIAKSLRNGASHAVQGFEDQTQKIREKVFSLTKVLRRRTSQAKTESKQVAQQVVEATKSVDETSLDVVEPITDPGVKSLQQGTDSVQNTVQQVTQQVVEVIESVYTKSKEIVKPITDPGNQSLQRGKDAVKKEVQQMIQQVVEMAEWVCEQAQAIVGKIKENAGKSVQQNKVKLTEAIQQTQTFIQQTKKVLEGNLSIPDRIVSFFDPEARPITKGKISKKTEFGFKVRIDETESGFVTGYEVYKGNPSDESLLVPTVEQHQETFGEVPHAVATDRGFFSQRNEETLSDQGVQHISMPKRGHKSKQRTEYEKQPCFRNLQRFRAGGEARISLLKRKYGLDRSLYRGLTGTKTWVGMAIFAHNLRRAATMALATVALATMAPETMASETITPTTMASDIMTPTAMAPTTMALATVASATMDPETTTSTTIDPTTMTPTTMALATVASATMDPETTTSTTIDPTTMTPTIMARDP